MYFHVIWQFYKETLHKYCVLKQVRSIPVMQNWNLFIANGFYAEIVHFWDEYLSYNVLTASALLRLTLEHDTDGSICALIPEAI